MGESKRRRAAEASSDENSVPGSHGPVSKLSDGVMRAILHAVKEAYPDLEVTLFVFEGEGKDGQAARYNYASTVNRDDMVAVLKSFIDKQDEMKAIDAAMDAPAKGSA